MAIAPVIAGITAAIVGCGGSIAVVLAATAAAGATPAQTASWVAGLCLAIALSSGWLSFRYRLPIVTAWSTPGAALIATTPGLTMESAVAAFLLAAALILLTAAITPLGRLVERLPLPIASAMLAGVLFKIVISPFESASTAPLLILPLVAFFVVARLIVPTMAVLAILIAAVTWSWGLGLLQPLPPLTFTTLVWIAPSADVATALGLGLPLYLVTMASQNLAGFAVLRASGYDKIPTTPILGVTGGLSLATACLGAHTSNLAAISAAICTGPDCHPDLTRRWPAGIAYMVCYLAFAAVAPTLVALFASLPSALVKTIAGLALAGAMFGALKAALGAKDDLFAPGLTFAITASGMTLFGVGAAFWGLAAGLAAFGLSMHASKVHR